MTCGIYAIKNKENGKVYIGLSVNIGLRWGVHKAELRHGKHWNQHLQLSWNKHGESGFDFVVLQECSEEELSKTEKDWILKLNSDDNSSGYNLTDGGEGGRPTEEIRKVMSEKATGRKGYWTGKSLSDETKRKIGESRKLSGNFRPTMPVVHLETGIEYKSCSEAAKTLFPDILAACSVIYKVACGLKKSYRGTTWAFVGENRWKS